MATLLSAMVHPRRALLRALVGAPVAALLPACTDAPQRLDRAAASDVKTILLLPTRFPPARSLYDPSFSSTSQSDLGTYAIGLAAGLGYLGLVAAGPTRAVEAASAGQDRIAEQTLNSALASALRVRGFTVLTTPVAMDDTWDASLAVTVAAFGYYPGDPLFRSWGPCIRLHARLVRQRDKAVLMDVGVAFSKYGEPAGLNHLHVIDIQGQDWVRVSANNPQSTSRLNAALQSAVSRCAAAIASYLN